MKKNRIREALHAAGIILLCICTLLAMLIISGYTTKEKSELDGFVYRKEIPLTKELQEHLWIECGKYGIDYSLALGSIQLESCFDEKAKHENDNGTTDRGLCQVNSCNVKRLKELGYITCKEDLMDPYKNIECGMYLLGICVEKFGNTEAAYYYYNTGKARKGSNSASRTVWEYTQEWRKLLGE